MRIFHFLTCLFLGLLFGHLLAKPDFFSASIVVCAALTTLLQLLPARRVTLPDMGDLKGKELPVGPMADGWYFARNKEGGSDVLTLVKDGVMLATAHAPHSMFEELAATITSPLPADEKVTLQ